MPHFGAAPDVANAANPWGLIPHITNPFNLAAFALAVVLYLVLKRRRGEVAPMAWVVILLLVIIPVGASVYQEFVKDKNSAGGIYRVRVTVIDPQKVPVEDAKIWSSFGGEAKHIAGGWQFDIPAASKPQDGMLTLFAAQENAFLKGEFQLQLGGDYNPAVTVQLQRDDSARVRGQVVDSDGHAVVGAQVWVVGYGHEGVTTTHDGHFELAAHAAVAQQSRLHAEKPGHKVMEQDHPAGGEPVTLILLK